MTNDTNPEYPIDRMLWLSRILQPEHKAEPYRRIYARRGDADEIIAALPDILDRNELAEQIKALLKASAKAGRPQEERLKALREALDQAPRAGEEFSLALLDRVPAALDALTHPDPSQLEPCARLLEKSLFVAAHFDHTDYVQQLAARFERLLALPKGADTKDWFDALIGQCFRGLRKLGMRDVIDRLMRKMAAGILVDSDLDDLTVEWADEHPADLQVLLHVAAGWFYFGRSGEAEVVLKAARALLFDGALDAKTKARLACVYATTLGQAPVEMAQRRLEELFQKLEGISDPFTTNRYYGWLQLQVVEAVVRAVVSDDFLLGADARRWLDDDEYLVRRRIHQDVKTMMGAS